MDRCTSVRMFVAVAASALLMSEIAAAQQIQSLGGLSQRQGQSLGGFGQRQGPSLGGSSQGQGGQTQLQVGGLCQIQTQSLGQTTTFAETDLVATQAR